MKCHVLRKGADESKCLECHGEIDAGIRSGKGYHAHLLKSEKQSCFACHSEHNGRKFALIHWPRGETEFSHDVIGYLLEASHRELSCRKCHQPKNIVHDPRRWRSDLLIEKTYLGLDRRCVDCHADEHRGQLGADCTRCHDQQHWKPAPGFAHDNARYRLQGKHVPVECARCHPAVPAEGEAVLAGDTEFVRYTGLAFESCSPCHADPHRGRLGGNCAACHAPAGWKAIPAGAFDHSRTAYPLEGRHAATACEKCHRRGEEHRTLPYHLCTDCHRDVHLGEFAGREDQGRCDICHDVAGFMPPQYGLAEHERSAYPLSDAHRTVPCVSCHKKENRGPGEEVRRFKIEKRACPDCHPDAHHGQFAERVAQSGCEGCHRTTAWSEVAFDHGRSRYPLTGRHAEAACDKCHKPAEGETAEAKPWVVYRPLGMACGDCHADIHRGQFLQRPEPKTCDDCHDTLSWKNPDFVHDRDSLFPLTGAHERVPCVGCHQRSGGQGPPGSPEEASFVLYRPLERSCASCHGPN